nr:aminotransferase class I/II-fold pyridoxal phosphate-dependent enzyme [Streptomyces hainanensis]
MEEGYLRGPLKETDRPWRLSGIVQQVSPDGRCDLGPGYLASNLVPVTDVARAYQVALARYGAAALSYGHNQGPLPLRAAVAARIALAEGVDCDARHVLVTAGTSQMLDVLAGVLGAPGDTVLVEALHYDLGVRILRDRGLTVRAVEMDESGMDPGALDLAVRDERAAGRRVALAYLVPTFHNPTGRLMPAERRRSLLDVAARHGLVVVEDDAYGELGLDDGPRCPSLATMSAFRGVIRLGTFSKSLAPGLRLGWLAADPGTTARLAGLGLFDSGGCPNQVAALAVAGLLEDGGYDRHLARLRPWLARRRDALLDALRGCRPAGFHVAPPRGGLFLWVRLPPGYGEQAATADAARVGVSVTPGSRFGADGDAVRLAYGQYDPERLSAAGAALTDAWNSATKCFRR